MTVKMIVSSEVRDSIPLDEVLNLIKKNYVCGTNLDWEFTH